MKKKILFLFILLVIIFGFTTSVNAHMGKERAINEAASAEENSITEEHKGLDEVLVQILKKYDVSTIQELDCGRVSDEDFEIIGDGVMEAMSSGVSHSAMDDMMGGEDSESLRQAHINMGKNYLGCFNDNVLGFGMMGKGFNTSMMAGFNGISNFLSLVLIINSILLTALLIILIRYFWKKGGEKK